MLAHQLQRPHRPRTVQIIPEFVFASEAIEVEGRRVLRGQKHGEYSLPVAVGTMAPSSAEDALAVFPQHLETIIAAGLEPKGGVHLSEPSFRVIRSCFFSDVWNFWYGK
jgi:hypothetical protein